MIEYAYSKIIPKSNGGHYMYAPFQGVEFLCGYLKSRRDWYDRLTEQGEDEREKPLSRIDLEGSVHSTFETLRALAVLRYQGKKLPKAIPGFYRKRIEIARFLHDAYLLPSGEKRSVFEAVPSAYAYAAFVFVCEMQEADCDREWLRWFNTVLKTMDIIVATGVKNLNPFALYCVRSVIEIEESTLTAFADVLEISL